MKNKLSTWIPGSLGLLAILVIAGSLYVDTADAGTCWDCVTKLEWGIVYDSRCCEDGNYSAICQDYKQNGYVRDNNTVTCKNSANPSTCTVTGVCSPTGGGSGGGGGPFHETPGVCTYHSGGYCPAWCSYCTWG